MSTVKERFKEILDDLDKDYDNFYIEDNFLYSKASKTLEGRIKIVNCGDETMCVKFWVVKLHKHLESGMIMDSHTHAEIQEKIAAVLSDINDELN